MSLGAFLELRCLPYGILPLVLALTAEQVSAEAIQSLTQYSYDSVGRLQCTAVRMNPAEYGSLPSDASVLSVQGSAGPDRINKNE